MTALALSYFSSRGCRKTLGAPLSQCAIKFSKDVEHAPLPKQAKYKRGQHDATNNEASGHAISFR